MAARHEPFLGGMQNQEGCLGVALTFVLLLASLRPESHSAHSGQRFEVKPAHCLCLGLVKREDAPVLLPGCQGSISLS